MGLQTAATKATAALLEEHHREQSEDLDVDGLSDAEMGSPSELMEPETFGLARSHHNLTLEQRHVSTKESGLDRADLDIDFDNDLDADMNMILGMASDMELVMPKFDDEYLDDLRNDPVLVTNMNVLTPQEVQEDYYARRSLRASQQRRRRRSSVMSAAIAQDANRSNASAPFRVEGFSPVPGPLRSTSRPAFFPGVHPFDTSTMPVPAIGPTPIPASYYIPPSAFRTEADVAAEREAERKRKQEEEDLKESFLVFPSPSLA
ncbi:hypothetical protein BGX28_006052 [Mortierella sp. GBA30]|nr:hypothetical protein BGX28_006052 [Mortierella sp. GBA30]